jgi:hypothetical protein
MRSFSLKWALAAIAFFAAICATAIYWPVTEREVYPASVAAAQAEHNPRVTVYRLSSSLTGLVVRRPPTGAELTMRIALAYSGLVVCLGVYAITLYRARRRQIRAGDGLLHIRPGDPLGQGLPRAPYQSTRSRRRKWNLPSLPP